MHWTLHDTRDSWRVRDTGVTRISVIRNLGMIDIVLLSAASSCIPWRAQFCSSIMGQCLPCHAVLDDQIYSAAS
eukprot:398360-Amphidinium_carterae.1